MTGGRSVRFHASTIGLHRLAQQVSRRCHRRITTRVTNAVTD